MTSADRYHDISCGHRVVGHEGSCVHLHGHNYRIHFKITANTLDEVGRILDFSVIKHLLCSWIDNYWDHRFLVWEQDPIKDKLIALDPTVAVVSFNPTAENIAKFLVQVVGPQQLRGTETTLTSCTVDETRKCSATYELTHIPD